MPVRAPILIIFVAGTLTPIFIFPVSLLSMSNSAAGVGVSISVVKIDPNVTVPCASGYYTYSLVVVELGKKLGLKSIPEKLGDGGNADSAMYIIYLIFL